VDKHIGQFETDDIVLILSGRINSGKGQVILKQCIFIDKKINTIKLGALIILRFRLKRN